ncbi:N-acetylmuramoyl-L-alanine amidase [Corynebacterium sp. H78]|uniref:N-acetylmuramoyl-L-alanine amidase n=1 Tax=Corynebacterium sp. H78 TaxID=3133417 RepID=UPI00309700D1
MLKQRSSSITRITFVASLLSLGMLFSGCTIGDVAESGGDVQQPAEQATITKKAPSNDGPQPTPSAAQPSSDATDARAGASSRSQERKRTPMGNVDLSGRTIYLDPGHAAVMQTPMTQVTDGRGGMKPCQVSGTNANDGWPEHTFNWEMAQVLRKKLEAAGATVALSRPDDTGQADCIDVRTEKENASNADVVLSLHADGAGEGNRGFHIITVADPLPGNQADKSESLATALRDAFVAASLTPSNYLGQNGIDYRADLTGLNLSTKPKVLIEFGNMRDSEDIALLQSPDGQATFADAIVKGVAASLGS